MSAELSQAVTHLEARLGVGFRLRPDGQYRGPCPACEAGNPKGHHLYVRPGTSSPVVFFCARGCSWPEIRAAGALDDLKETPRLSAAPDWTYDYTTRDGSLDVQVLRWGRGPGKKVQQRRPKGGGWEYQLNGHKPGLFRLHRLVTAAPGSLCLLAEGEPDVLQLERLGFLATTSIRGTSGWEAGYTRDLAGFRVAILPDHDEPGVKLARQRLTDCQAAGIEAAIVWFDYPITKDQGKDVSDWLTGHDKDELAVRVELAFAGQLLDPEAPAPFYHFLTEAELLALPAPEWRVENFFEARELTVVYGLTSCGKTFLTGDVALHVAAGLGWCGRAVHAGRVLYVNADGGRGFGKRVKAWRSVNGTEGTGNLMICDQAVNTFDPQAIGPFIEQLTQDRYDLVVLDTLSQCAAGADEVSTRDMGLIGDAIRRLMIRALCGVWIVHHSTKDGASARGVASLVNAAATVIAVKKPEREMLVTCEKQRNWDTFPPMAFRLKPVDDSCILVEEGGRLFTPPARKDATKAQILMLAVREPGITGPELMERTEIAQTTLYNYISQLAAEGLVVVERPPETEGLTNRPPKGLFPTPKALREATG